MNGPVHHILEQPLIPPPLHGLNPRTIMGQAKWDVMRKEIYKKHGYCCASCGVRSRDAIIKQYLEAHERFTIDWQEQRMTLISMEPLCHACHAFVHTGLLEVRLQARRVCKQTVASILGHGVGVLERANGTMPVAAHNLCRKLGLAHGIAVQEMPPRTRWTGWKMKWEGVDYPSPYPTERDWQNAMRKMSVN